MSTSNRTDRFKVLAGDACVSADLPEMVNQPEMEIIVTKAAEQTSDFRVHFTALDGQEYSAHTEVMMSNYITLRGQEGSFLMIPCKDHHRREEIHAGLADRVAEMMGSLIPNVRAMADELAAHLDGAERAEVLVSAPEKAQWQKDTLNGAGIGAGLQRFAA